MPLCEIYFSTFVFSIPFHRIHFSILVFHFYFYEIYFSIFVFSIPFHEIRFSLLVFHF